MLKAVNLLKVASMSNANERAREVARAILIGYSSVEHDQTICRMSELEAKIVRELESAYREKEQHQQMHDAYMRVWRDVEKNRSFLSRLFA